MFCINTRCPACSAGPIGFRRCSDEKTMVLLCSECDVVWLRPDAVTLETAIFLNSPDFVVDGLDCSVGVPLSRWAKKGEIEAVGWDSYIAGEST